MGEYQRTGREYEFLAAGIDVNTPVDRLKPTLNGSAKGKYPIMKNVICTQDGTIEPRPAILQRYTAATVKTPWHTTRRLNDSSSGTAAWALVHGIGDSLQVERSSAVGTVANLETGYSGNPLSMVAYRPPSSPQPWMYVGDTARMRKINVTASSTHGVGISKPTKRPRVFPDTGLFRTVDLFESNVGWGTVTPGASVGVAAARVNTTVSTFKYWQTNPTGLSTGSYTVIAPAAGGTTNVGVGTVLTIAKSGGGTEDVIVSQVNKASAGTQIKQILSEGSTNNVFATIVTKLPFKEVQVGSLVSNITRGTSAIVERIDLGADGSLSFAVIGADVTLWQAGDTIQCLASFVCQMVNQPVLAGAITSNMVPLNTAASGSSKFTKTIALDLSQLVDSAGNPVPVTLDELMHISLKVDHPELVSEIKLYLDIDATTNNFTQNYYVLSISPSDFTPVTKSTQSALDNRQLQIRRRLLDGRPRMEVRMVDPNLSNDPLPDLLSNDPGDPTDPSRQQLTPGDNQYSEVILPISALTKVGADDSRGLPNVAAIQIEAITTGAVVISCDAWTVLGGFGPDATEIMNGYQFAYRWRVSGTGAVSELSAPSGVVFPRRQRTSIVIADSPAVGEVDQADIFAIGGTLDTWSYVASIPYSIITGTYTFGFTLNDGIVRVNDDADGTFDPTTPDRKPWCVQDVPHSGTADIVAGSYVHNASNAFDTSWAPGGLLIINGIPTILLRVISQSLLEVTNNMGGLTNVPWEFKQPIKLGQPLRIFGGEKHDFLFAFDDKLNPGMLYYSKPKNADSTALKYRIELTNGSEAILNGFVFNGRPGVFTNRRLFYLDYTPGSEEGLWTAHESPGVKGLYSRFAMDVNKTRGVAWLAEDGIYLLGPERIMNMTSDDLQPLFPFAGRFGTDTNTIKAPNMPNPVGAEEKFLRLCFGEDNALYFIYRDGSSNQQCMRYDFEHGGWFPYSFAAPITFVYSEEGPGVRNLVAGGADAGTASLYNLGGSADNGIDVIAGPTNVPIPCQIRTPSYDLGEPRSEKQFGDIEIDIDPGGASITVQPGFDNFATTVAPTVLSGSGRISPPTLIDLQSGGGQFARNIALDISWNNGAGQKPKLYLWQPSLLAHPEATQLRATDYEFVQGKLLYVRGFWINAMTMGGVRSLTVDYVDHVGASQTFVIPNINQPVKSKVYYSAVPPFYASTLRYRPTDANKWRLYRVEPDGDPAPEYSDGPTAFTDDGVIGNKFLQGFVVDIDTHGNPVVLNVQGDAGVTLQSPPSISCALRSPIPVTLDPAVITHLMRLDPSAACHIFGVKWFYQTEAELSNYYESQALSGELPGFKHMREVWIAYYGASNPITLAITTDAGTVAGIPPLPASASYARKRILIPAGKYKQVKLTLSSTTAFGLDREGCEVRIKAWAALGDYQIWKPFGFPRGDRGIAVI